MHCFTGIISFLVIFFISGLSTALSATHESVTLDLTLHPVGFIAIGIFVLAYLFVMLEEVTSPSCSPLRSSGG